MGNPLISGKSRLVKYYHLARILEVGKIGFQTLSGSDFDDSSCKVSSNETEEISGPPWGYPQGGPKKHGPRWAPTSYKWGYLEDHPS